jgi:hypothetical protein
MNRDYERIIAIIKHEGNEQKHLNSIINCIFLFKNKWVTEVKTTEEILTYSAHCLTIDDEYEKLKQRIYGD